MAPAAALHAILTRLGWRVADVHTIGQAFIRLAEPFDMLILDLMLPDGDGLDVLRHVHRLTPKCRVAVTTGVSDPERLKMIADCFHPASSSKPIDLQAYCDFSKPH